MYFKLLAYKMTLITSLTLILIEQVIMDICVGCNCHWSYIYSMPPAVHIQPLNAFPARIIQTLTYTLCSKINSDFYSSFVH